MSKCLKAAAFPSATSRVSCTEFQPTQNCALTNPTVKTIPKSKRNSMSKSEPKPHLSPLDDPPDLFFSHANINMSSKTKKPKVKETLADDFSPDPQKIFRHLNSCQKLPGFLAPLYLDRSELFTCLTQGILRQQMPVIRSEVGSVDTYKLSSQAMVKLGEILVPVLYSPARRSLSRWSNKYCFEVGHLHPPWLGGQSAVYDTLSFS